MPPSQHRQLEAVAPLSPNSLFPDENDQQEQSLQCQQHDSRGASPTMPTNRLPCKQQQQPLVWGLQKKTTMKSSFALTDMLADLETAESATIPSGQSTSSSSGYTASCSSSGSSAEDDNSASCHYHRSLPLALVDPVSSPEPLDSPAAFGLALDKVVTQSSSSSSSQEDTLNFRDSPALRQTLEAPLRRARKLRDAYRRRASSSGNHGSPPFSPSKNPQSTTTTTTTMDNYHQTNHGTSWVGLPYASLRSERPFLYDPTHTHPLHEILQSTLHLDTDLSQLHQTWDPAKESARDHQRRIFQPLLDASQRKTFHTAYDSFVTECCIPLLHATALQKKVFHSSHHDSARHREGVSTVDIHGISQTLSSSCSFHHHHSTAAPPSNPILYRYQVFPTITVVYPNDPQACRPPSCDLNRGHSVGWLHFHIPLTANVGGTSALWVEHYPGREDWHPLRCKSVGLGYCWDGARNVQFTPLNTTPATRVSLDFRILLVRASSVVQQASTCSSSSGVGSHNGNSSGMLEDNVMDDDVLCRPHHLEDSLTCRDDGFYEEATMGRIGGASKIMRRRGGAAATDCKREPDARCGFPFA